MSEQNSAQEKTEEASQQKLKKSREEGQVARSKDLSTTLSLLVTLFALKFSTGLFHEGLQESFRLAYLDFGHSEIGLDDLSLILGHNLLIFIKLLAPLLITPLLVVVFSLVPGGWVFSSKNFTPKLSKLNPITGLGRMFSMQNWSELLKSVLKILVLFAIAGWLLAEATPQLIALQRTDIRTAIGSAVALAFDMTLSLLLVFVLFSLIDIPLQRFFFLKKLRMTKQERKEEHKNQEGRPEVKARIKQVQRQLLQRQISRVIKNADVVIVNPQHFAVALKYDPKKAQAPYVIAKGVDETALYIRKMAQANQLEVLELPPLARAIYFSTQVNQQIPAPLYTAVAHVLTYILQLKAYRQGRRGRPVLAANLPIPDSMANRSQP
ncbi:flagellar biosynthesis protein FlhB [Pseudomonas indica]|uniref:Flagellar biosynthetic protein FlhB n=1 Tax=Pseudomonas indica TaxID=137658 RepID=A0A1G9H549_9PSED|nr:flagellar biosynthesis protein FlhB [Pseudomonas indica]PAU65415.1 flagellar biosynthesis protein FlhB [Pseudomonas indica]SDL08067.1 flagellar biosynthetic protein FlhB [Pseudomonas indica]